MDLLKQTIDQAVKAVHMKRKAQGTLYTEREWWTLAPQVARLIRLIGIIGIIGLIGLILDLNSKVSTPLIRLIYL